MLPFITFVNEQEIPVLPTQAQALDTLQLNENEFHILKNDANYKAKVENADFANKTFAINLNGTVYNVKIADKYDRLIKQMGISATGSAKLNNVKSPMPGLVLSVLVSEGQSVSKGDNLLILEAMKMENVLKATGEGIIKSIKINQGSIVEKGQLLIEMV